MRFMLLSVLRYFPIFERVLRRALSNFYFLRTDISADYKILANEEAHSEGLRLRSSWQDGDLPQRQRNLVEKQLNYYRRGYSVDVFDVFVKSLSMLPGIENGATLLEVGCSSGFYSEVIELSGLPINYSGCDYSDAFIGLAKKKYPSVNFAIEDATKLNFRSSSFDIVVSGCCLLHIPEYIKAIEETGRVTRRFAIFHRTPVVWGMPEIWYRKKAYGVETIEIHFNEDEFLNLLVKNNLELISTFTLNEKPTTATSIQGHATRTYVCRKRK